MQYYNKKRNILVQGKPLERKGRKAMGLRSNDYDCQAADNYYRAVLMEAAFIFY